MTRLKAMGARRGEKLRASHATRIILACEETESYHDATRLHTYGRASRRRNFFAPDFLSAVKKITTTRRALMLV